MSQLNDPKLEIGFEQSSLAPPPPPPPPPGQSFKNEAIFKHLSDSGWPLGLQNALIAGLIKTPARFFICDNSTSMTSVDGHWVVGEGDHTKYVLKSRLDP